MKQIINNCSKEDEKEHRVSDNQHRSHEECQEIQEKCLWWSCLAEGT